jgi:AcrR family transcriptional regulator
MAASPRSRLALDERRAQLLERGLELFSSRSYDEISIDDIAAAAGVSKGLLYHYFPTKRDFYVATVRGATEEMRNLTEPDEALAPVERLRQSLEAYLDYVEAHAVGYRTLLRGGIGSDAEVRDIVEETRSLMIERFLEGMERDEPGPGVRLALRGWLGFCEEASLAWLDRRDVARAELVAIMMMVLGAALAAAGQMGEDVRGWMGERLLGLTGSQLPASDTG